MLSSILLTAALAAAATTTHDLVVHEQRPPLQHVERRRLDGNAIIPVRIALTQRDLEQGYLNLMVRPVSSLLKQGYANDRSYA